MRKKFIAGNWKMNATRAETASLVRGLIEKTADIEKTTIMVAPPFTDLDLAADLLMNSKIHLGAQNMHWEDTGAFTGEISPVMLRDLGCEYVILGHSERRQHFRETDDDVNRKVRAALKHGLLPIICFGETLEERQSGHAVQVVERHIRKSLENFSASEAARFTIAYEPVWAIGTGKPATLPEALEMHVVIRNLLGEMFGKETAEVIRIQYGGSVAPENVSAFIKEEQIDGGLVGGASLKADLFSMIVAAAEQASS